jgi:hypothetical protein
MTITTEDGNRQNLFAVEPKMYITEKDMEEHEQETYAQRAEIWNSRTAMVGVVAGLVSYALTGNLFFGIY